MFTPSIDELTAVWYVVAWLEVDTVKNKTGQRSTGNRGCFRGLSEDEMEVNFSVDTGSTSVAIPAESLMGDTQPGQSPARNE